MAETEGQALLLAQHGKWLISG